MRSQALRRCSTPPVAGLGDTAATASLAERAGIEVSFNAWHGFWGWLMVWR